MRAVTLSKATRSLRPSTGELAGATSFDDKHPGKLVDGSWKSGLERDDEKTVVKRAQMEKDSGRGEGARGCWWPGAGTTIFDEEKARFDGNQSIVCGHLH